MKHLRYLRYVIRHKWFVMLACFRRGLIWRGIKHDWSKFLPCEWVPYAEYFYGEAVRLKKEEADDFQYWTRVAPYHAAFDRAWLHHQHYNDHHWQHWVLRNDDGSTKALPMPELCVREMLADWEGAGRAITGKAAWWEWYSKNKARMILHEATVRKVEEAAQKDAALYDLSKRLGFAV